MLNIFGSFFPAWMLCAFIGIVAAIIARLVLARSGLAGAIRPPLVAYPSVALIVTFTLWLTFYGH
jgi:hypothetical protein